MAVLQAFGRVFFDAHVFANVGTDSENPATLAYVENYLKPYCEDHHIRFVETQKLYRGKPDTLRQALERPDRSIIIPARMGHNGAHGNRNCTQNFKIEVVDRWVKQQGVTHVVTGLGISIDEIERVRSQSWHLVLKPKQLKALLAKYSLEQVIVDLTIRPKVLRKRREYPLVDLRMTRQACKDLIAEAGLPLPPKSSCYFCPYHKRGEWLTMKREEPELFAQACEVEQTINRKRLAINRDGLFLHPDLVPLDRAVGEQMLLFDFDVFDTCDAGVCFT